MGLHLKEGADDDLAEVHEINVTPFIDVMLVLLIIFMVAAPLATVDLGLSRVARRCLGRGVAAGEPRPRASRRLASAQRDTVAGCG